MDKDSLGDRMKRYETVTQTHLIRRMPVIIRVDGKAFHTYTRHCKKPYDLDLMQAFHKTMEYVALDIQGCKLAYHQSDEISFLLTDYENLETSAWFDYNVQKLCSITASLTTAYFREFYCREELALFDSRVFNLTKEEVCNYFIWRQQDTVRNSVQAAAHALFPHKSLQNLSSKLLQEKMFSEKGINWNDYPTTFKRGTCWSNSQGLDLDIPTFTADRDYIERHL